jgi:D-lactate dehydrogenase
MKIAFFDTKSYDKISFSSLLKSYSHEITFLEPKLTPESAQLASDHDAVCIFVQDVCNAQVLEILKDLGIHTIALRCAGFNNVDLDVAESYGMKVVRVPAYSPYAVAEHTLGLILGLNRNIHRAYNRVRESNFSLEGLLGFDLNQKTVGVIGTGKIGSIVVKILKGFGCHVLAYDQYKNSECIQNGAQYVELDELLKKSDIVTLHCPLNKDSKHLINSKTIKQMKDGVMIVNTSRGALVDTNAVIEGLKSHKVGYLALDVYEEEDKLFFEDMSGKVLQDDTFARLLTFPNVIITGHQAFFTKEALHNIAETTLQNLNAIDKKVACGNLITQ